MCKMKGGEKMKVLKEQNPQQMVKIEGRLDSYDYFLLGTL